MIPEDIPLRPLPVHRLMLSQFYHSYMVRVLYSGLALLVLKSIGMATAFVTLVWLISIANEVSVVRDSEWRSAIYEASLADHNAFSGNVNVETKRAVKLCPLNLRVAQPQQIITVFNLLPSTRLLQYQIYLVHAVRNRLLLYPMNKAQACRSLPLNHILVAHRLSPKIIRRDRRDYLRLQVRQRYHLPFLAGWDPHLKRGGERMIQSRMKVLKTLLFGI